ncbi:nicotinate-nicotinamide nucleotide adenylyltransferase [Vibrio sp.]|nr:nicotinate-nicotinamide nucleotide adenylyltransferase [Vibrio sp.]
MKKIAVFGSAFNPPSLGHKSVIESLSHFDEVLLLPSIAHAWGKEMLPYDQRCELVNAFLKDIEVNNAQLSTIEKEIYKNGESVITYEVLIALQSKNPEAELTFILGPDNFFNFSRFAKAEEIVQRWHILMCPENVKIRSTDIRNALKDKRTITGLTTDSVVCLIQQNQYYD